MSERYPGGIITKNPATPTGPFENGTAPGVWTLEQQMQFQQQGVWPLAGNVPNYIEDVFSTYLYTGNGSTQTITNGIDLSTNGGMVWQKDRTTAGTDGVVCDTARGVNAFLRTSGTYASVNNGGTDAVYAYNSNGFSTGTTNGFNINLSGDATVSWTFAKAPKFFDVLTYTGDGASGRAISHNLGSVPGCIIVKRTDTTGAWAVYHRSVTDTDYKVLTLNNTDAVSTPGDEFWSISNITSTTFGVGTAARTNASGGTYVAYLFAHDAGGFGLTGTDNVISCGSFTASSGAATVTLGYEPQWIMFKRTDSSTGGNWYMVDVMRGWSFSAVAELSANTSNAEDPNAFVANPTATGFSFGTGTLTASGTYIYIAIRRPMKVPTSGASVFTPATHTGTGTAISLTAAGFPPDLFWSANRDTIRNRSSHDRLRGIGLLVLNLTNSEDTGYTNSLTSFNMTGISVGTDSSAQTINNSAKTYAHYYFRRAPSFMDVVCYTGTGSATTFNHNLAAVPELMIVKERNGANGWQVYSASLTNTEYLILNTSAGVPASSATRWNSTTPTSTVFSVGTHGATNGSGQNFVNYLFATCAGVSKVGSYTGTATTLQIDCGFTGGARFVLIKRTDSTGDWYVWDTARGIVSGNDPYLLLNSTAAEVTNTDYVDTYSAGFEISSTAPAAINANGGTFIFLAIA